jgi:hypothetical protein
MIIDCLLLLGGIATAIVTYASEILLFRWPDIVRAPIGGEAIYYLWNVSSLLERDIWAISLIGVLFGFWIIMRKRVALFGQVCAVVVIGLNAAGFVLDRWSSVQLH